MKELSCSIPKIIVEETDKKVKLAIFIGANLINRLLVRFSVLRIKSWLCLDLTHINLNEMNPVTAFVAWTTNVAIFWILKQNIMLRWKFFDLPDQATDPEGPASPAVHQLQGLPHRLLYGAPQQGPSNHWRCIIFPISSRTKQNRLSVLRYSKFESIESLTPC